MSADEPFGHPAGSGAGEPPDPLLPPVLQRHSPEVPTADRIPHRYRGSMAAAALAAGMIGLRDILEEPKDDRPVVEQHAEDPHRDRPIWVDLDPDDPTNSVVTLRGPIDG